MTRLKLRPKLNLIHFAIFFAVIDAVQFSANGYVEAFMLGSFHFYFNDLAVFLIWFAIIVNVTAWQRMTAVSTAASCFLLIELLWLGRGLSVGIFNALIAFRYLADFMAFAVFFLIVRPKWRVDDKVLQIFGFGSILLIGLFVARLIYGSLLFLRDINILSILDALEYRAIDAYGAMVLGCCSVMFFHFAVWRYTGRLSHWYYFLFVSAIAVELLSRQRTSTLATVAGFAAYFICSPKSWSRMAPEVRSAVILSLVSVGIIMLISSSSSLLDLFPQVFAESLTKVGTLEARQEIWSGAFHEFSSREFYGKLFGTYAGYVPPVFVRNGVWILSLHSQYVQTLSNFGFAGLAAFCSVIGIGFYSAVQAALRRKPDNSAGIAPALAVSWLSMMFVFGYAYEWSEIVSIFAILACAPWPGDAQEPARNRDKHPAYLFGKNRRQLKQGF
jgi:hypothetical protein